ncbi:MAG: 6-phosphogluconolactonase, partial [Anaerolineales bacterium]|nr:6-phosphogluconolactonase [Anaerolineales bacterium]
MSLTVFPDAAALANAAAARFAALAAQAAADHGRFLVALSGGSTPQALFARLAQPPYRDALPWPHTHVFWGDERLVPP